MRPVDLSTIWKSPPTHEEFQVRRETIESIVAEIVEVMAAHAPTRDEMHAALALAIKDLAPRRTDRLRVLDMATRK
jgi:hypothetical protein